MDIVSKLRYMARQYTNSELSRGGNPTRHYLDEAADEIESLRARVAELEADNKEMNSHLSRIGAILDDVDYLGEHSVGVQALKNRVAELEAGMGEPVAWYIFEKDMATTDHEWANENSDMVEPLYTTPQPTPTVQAAVAAAMRKAAEVCEQTRKAHDDEFNHYKQGLSQGAKMCCINILSIPHDDSALREICSAIIEETLDVTGWAVPVKHEVITARVLGEVK